MDALDSSTRHELSKNGYVFNRSATASVIVKTLLRDLSKAKQISEDIEQLRKRNNELSLTTMLYRGQIEEKDAELKLSKDKAEGDCRILNEQIKLLESLVPGGVSDVPKCQFFRRLAMKEPSDSQAVEVIKKADKTLHKLEETNRSLMAQLDKNVLNSGILINRIKLRDAEIQRLTDLVDKSSGLPQSKKFVEIARDENRKLQRLVEDAEQNGSSNFDYSELRSQLSKAEADRRELARQVDHLTSKITAIQGVRQQYEHELKMARMERDDALRQAKPAVVPEEVPKGQSVREDENGNVTLFSEERRKNVNFCSDKEREERRQDEMAAYEKKMNKLLADQVVLRDAVTKKDSQINHLRSEMAMLSVANEENDELRKEVSTLRRNATCLKKELRELRERISEYTSEAARVVDAADLNGQDGRGRIAGKASEVHRQPVGLRERTQTTESSDDGLDREKARRLEGIMTNRRIVEETISPMENLALKEKLTLLECEVRRLTAKTALEEENRLRTEARLRQMEENPSKKFKGQLRIDGGVLRTEFELESDCNS